MKRRDFFKFAATAAAVPFLPKAFKGTPRQLATYRHDETLGAGVLDMARTVGFDRIEVNSDVFYPGQRIEIFSADMSAKRGSRKVVDASNGILTLDSRVPGDMAPGDLILLGGERLNGLRA